jgi:hypothetical protein
MPFIKEVDHAFVMSHKSEIHLETIHIEEQRRDMCQHINDDEIFAAAVEVVKRRYKKEDSDDVG